MAGDLTYFWIPSPDPERGRAFYGGLFGWNLQPREQGDGFHIEGISVPGGIVGGREGDRPHLYFGVDDLADTVAEVEDLGGHAEEIVEFYEGASSECGYDGVEFGLFRPADGLPAKPAPCDKPGDLGYFVVPVDVPDDARTFYAAVLGWEYEHDDIDAAYHHVVNVVPPGGLFTDVEATRPVSYFRVEYLDFAVRRVRELGGEVGESTDSATGSSVDCTDDQGIHFSLWQPAAGY
jgi:uncharacterized protein